MANLPKICRVIHVFDRISSTSLYAKHLADLGAADGTVVVAARQQSGYGRLGRDWASPNGGLWFSIILRPRIDAAEAEFFPMAAALGVGAAISDASLLEWGFRWPNDVVIRRRKVSGVLGESKISGEDLLYLVIGIGVNVNFGVPQLPAEIRRAATTLLHESRKRFDLAFLLVRILSSLETNIKLVQSGGRDEILGILRKHDVLQGRVVRLFTKQRAVIGVGRGIQSNGNLLVSIRGGDLHEYTVGEVERVELAEFGKADAAVSSRCQC